MGTLYEQRIDMRATHKCMSKNKSVCKCMGHEECMRERADKIYKCSYSHMKIHMTHYYRKDHKHVNNAKKKHKTVRKFAAIYNPNHTKTGGSKTTKTQ